MLTCRFWHPKFAYERVRQVIILLQNLMAFRKEHSCDDWPAVMTGGEQTSRTFLTDG